MISAVIDKQVNRLVPIYPLATFRIIFGILMMFSTARFVILSWIEDHYTQPLFHFHYFGFEWVEPLGVTGMYLVHALLFLASLLVTLGIFYRLSVIVQFILFTYTELIDLTYYLNHYYFVSIVCFLLILLPAHRCASLDVRFGRVNYANRVPAWCVNVLKMMVAIVYIYAGLAKINPDWLLEALPLKLWLPPHDKMPVLGPLFAWKWTPYFFAWAGMLFDTFIIFFLLYPKTRKPAYLAVVCFHTVTGLLFQIGVFPIVMMALVTIFFANEWHRKLLVELSRIFDKSHLKLLQSLDSFPDALNEKRRRAVVFFLGLFMAFQLLFPWRFVCYPGKLFWTEEGYRFGWRVMLMEKSGTATFFIKDDLSGQERMVSNSRFLNRHQEKQMAMQPDLILQYARFLADYYEQRGYQNPQVRAEVYVTLNGSPSRLYFDPQLNLLEVEDNWTPKDWIHPHK